MPSDLTAAASRYTADDNQCQMAFLQDAFALADFAASLLDETPIDQAWLESIGGVKQDNELKVRFYRGERLPVGLWAVGDGWKAMLEIGEHHSACIVRGLTTRGAVLRLCFALQIETKENV